ncbi:MAG: ATP-binding protein [Victivallales bacterium]|jgi:PAS domain S-box-containing protein
MKKKVLESEKGKSLRQRALEMMHKNPQAITDLTKKEIAELVQELGIYQIELEMQNEELRRAQAELESSNQKYSDLYDFAPVGYFILNKDGVILDANLTGTTLLGVEKSRMIGKHLSNYVNKDEQDRYFLFRRRTLESNARQTCEIKLKTGKGGIDAQLFAETVKDHVGDVQCRIAIADITERKQAEDAHRKSEAMLLRAQRVADLGCWEWNIVTGKLHWSDQVYSIFGLTPGEFTPSFESFLSMIIPEDREILNRFVSDTMTGHAYSIEYRILRPDSSVRHILAQGDVDFDKDGKPIRMFGTALDITERKQAEEELRASELRERERAEELATLLDSVPTPVFIAHDPDCHHITGNRAADELLKNPYGSEASLSASDELKPRHFKAVKDGRELRLDELPAQRAAHGEQVYDFDFSLVFVDGTVRHVLGYGTPLLNEHGLPRGAVHVLVDITERKKAEENLNNILEELKRSNSDLDQFASVANHDLREPLRTITSFLELLVKRCKGSLDQNAMEYIDFAVDGARRMDNLLAGLLKYSRVHSHGKPMKPTPVQASLDDAVLNLRKIIDENNVEIVSEPLPTVNGDWMQLMQLFQNLLHNAIKFKGEQRMQIHVACRKDGNFHLISVRDNGIGIEPQYHERVFTIFHRVNAKDDRSGHGVGLAVCKKIVERHGGKMWLESSPGKGSEFFFTLPC